MYGKVGDDVYGLLNLKQGQRLPPVRNISIFPHSDGFALA